MKRRQFLKIGATGCVASLLPLSLFIPNLSFIVEEWGRLPKKDWILESFDLEMNLNRSTIFSADFSHPKGFQHSICISNPDITFHLNKKNAVLEFRDTRLDFVLGQKYNLSYSL